uniref:Trehalase n=1 Tax=Romanomermis culicivorax TaxID=13658 RepID=A0A915J431_ROMCU
MSMKTQNCIPCCTYRTNLLSPADDLGNSIIGEKERVWSDVAAAAETGWDFSSRWFAHEGASAHRMASVRTASILPVDLNAFMCMNSRMLSELYKLLGDNAKSLLYEARFNQAKMIMTEMHWNATDGIWYDYDLEGHKHIRAYYISNAMPLFAHCYDENGEDKPLRVYEYMKAMGAFNSTKGIPTSFINSEQQWDAANSWPPMVHMIIEGFRTSKNTFLQTFAQKLAAQWLRANYKVFVETNAMYEKYDCSSGSTSAGSGGEYEVQVRMVIMLEFCSF